MRRIGRCTQRILIALSILAVCVTCEIQEYKVEIVPTANYLPSMNALYVELEASNTGEVSVSNVSCDVIVESGGSIVGTKSVSFGDIEPGESVVRNVYFYNLTLSGSYTVKVEDVDADIEKGGFGCANPLGV